MMKNPKRSLRRRDNRNVDAYRFSLDLLRRSNTGSIAAREQHYTTTGPKDGGAVRHKGATPEQGSAIAKNRRVSDDPLYRGDGGLNGRVRAKPDISQRRGRIRDQHGVATSRQLEVGGNGA